MRESVVAAMKQLAAGWAEEVRSRRQVSAIDPVADATEYRATELLRTLERVDDETRLLTVEQFAREHGHIASTVRRWCLRGELEAERNASNDWMIPRGAKRLKVGQHLDRSA